MHRLKVLQKLSEKHKQELQLPKGIQQRGKLLKNTSRLMNLTCSFSTQANCGQV